jgi:hypothetical protein
VERFDPPAAAKPLHDLPHDRLRASTSGSRSLDHAGSVLAANSRKVSASSSKGAFARLADARRWAA